MTNFDTHTQYKLVCKAIETLEDCQHGLASGHADSQQRLNALAQHMHTPTQQLERALAEWADLNAEQFFQCMQKDTTRRLMLAGRGFSHGGPIKNEVSHKTFSDNFADTFTDTLTIGQAQSPFGPAFICLAQEKLIKLEFETEGQHYADWCKAIQQQYPNTQFVESHATCVALANQLFSGDKSTPLSVVLKPYGTPFQLQIWEALTQLPPGQLISYQQLAQRIGKPTASRAVGSAVAKNPIAFLIPCHRVIQANGNFGQYHWQTTRKKAMHLWERGHA